MFNFSPKSGFGLDLSDLSFKIVQVKRDKKGLYLASYLKKDLPLGIVESGVIVKEKELVKIIRQALEKVQGEKLETNRVVCNLPEEKVFGRIVQLPFMEEDELAKAVKWEAEANIPLGIDDVYLGWQVIKPMFKGIDHLDIMVAASPKKIVDSYVSFLKKSGLEPLALEPESVAVVRSLVSAKELKPAIIIDLGATGTSFVIFAAGAIRFTSHINISGNLLEKAIIDQMKVSKEQAKKIKIEVGLDKKDKQVYQALEPVVSELADKINDYINFYHNHASHIHGPNGIIGQVVLCGGDSLLIGLDSFLKQKLKVPVKLGNPLVKLKESSNKKVFVAKGFSSQKPLSYTTALGLSTRDFIN